MSTKANNSKAEAVRVVMTPLGSAASNVFNMLNMSFFLVFSSEALGLNITAMGIIMTVMRIFDGITDPIIGSIIDRTETRFGKFRPFLVIGSLVMLFASFMIYLFSFDIPQSYRMVWVILWYAIWVIGYTFMTTVNKCVLSIVTKNPKYRPLSGIAGGCYSTMLGLIMTTLIVPILQKNGGLGSQKGWTLIIISAFVLHAVLLLGCLFAISATDKPEFYRQDPDKKEEKISIKDSLNVLRLNQPLRMLILAASTDKIASTIQTAVMTYLCCWKSGSAANCWWHLYSNVTDWSLRCRFCCCKIRMQKSFFNRCNCKLHIGSNLDYFPSFRKSNYLGIYYFNVCQYAV